MEDRRAYYAWAPPQAIWSSWAKPVLFTSFADVPDEILPPPGPLEAEDTAWLRRDARSTAVLVDLPSEHSVSRGLQLSAYGFRPVPLYNTTWGDNAVVPVRDLVGGLRGGADVLAARILPDDAPPAFLLDSERQGHMSPLLPGKYDNRWLVFPQDFPSARKLQEHGITRVVLWQSGRQHPREDLAHVLLRWQEAGISILAHDEVAHHAPKPIIVARPSGFRGLFRRLFAMAGFRRNAAGGFGGVVPQPSSGHG